MSQDIIIRVVNEVEPQGSKQERVTSMKSINEQYRVTDEQIDAATRFVNSATHEVLYIVKSASEEGKEYKVTYNRNFNRFQCECKASQVGMNCWHVRSALVNEMMYRQAKRDEAEAKARIAEVAAEHERLMMVKPTRPSEADVKADQKRFAPRPFSLLR
jgi:hypothetical protein